MTRASHRYVERIMLPGASGKYRYVYKDKRNGAIITAERIGIQSDDMEIRHQDSGTRYKFYLSQAHDGKHRLAPHVNDVDLRMEKGIPDRHVKHGGNLYSGKKSFRNAIQAVADQGLLDQF